MRRFALSLSVLVCLLSGRGGSEEDASDSSLLLLPQGVTLDLRQPMICDGVLTTEEGGVITGPNLRIQGRRIIAIRTMVDGEEQYRVSAEGDLILQSDDYVFTGSKLEYDFSTRTGYVLNGHSAVEPWYVSAKQIDILPGGDYELYDAYLTTAPSFRPEWHVQASNAYLTPCHTLYAKNVTLRMHQVPVLWLPCCKTNLNDLHNSPIKYRVRWGGQQGPRFGISYRVWETEYFQSTLRLDYRLSRGPGAALETEYFDCDDGTLFETRNYVARDSSISEPNERFRYRLQGRYFQNFRDDLFAVSATYDKVSDMDMPSDYAERDLEIVTSGLTQVNVRTQTDFCIANLTTRVRANSFETIKEEIPTIAARFHPFVIGPTGIISDNVIKAGYFDFKYSDLQPSVPDFNSTRLELRHSLYRPFLLGPINFTPDAGVVAIYYGNDPQHEPTWMVLGAFSAEVNTHLHRLYGNTKHVIEPYTRYQYFTLPNTDPSNRYVFDIHDGWYQVNALRLGLRHLLYQKYDEEDCPVRRLSADVYTYGFFHTSRLQQTFPRLFGDLTWDITPRLRYILNTGWDVERHQIAQMNNRIEWTLSNSFAFTTEYRHRNAFLWRKADPQNLMLDFFHSEEELRASPLSDRRNTLLLHAYWRLQHNLALEFRLQRGWDRIDEPNYREYQFDILKTFRSSWLVKLSYQKKTDDHRVAFYVSIGIKKPKNPCCAPWWASYCDDE